MQAQRLELGFEPQLLTFSISLKNFTTSRLNAHFRAQTHLHTKFKQSSLKPHLYLEKIYRPNNVSTKVFRPGPFIEP